MDSIVTRWHKVLECMQDGNLSFTQLIDDEDYVVHRMRAMMDDVKVNKLIAQMNSLPKFFFDSGLVKAMEKEGTDDSLEAMVQGGVATLPFPALVVEMAEEKLTRKGGEVRNFVFLYARKETEGILGEEKFHPFRAVVLRHILQKDGKQMLFVSPFTILIGYDHEAENGIGGTAFGYHYMVYDSPLIQQRYSSDPLVERRMQLEADQLQDTNQAGVALSAAILLLNTRGVAQETMIAPQKLNAARGKRRRPPIPDYVLVRVGAVYNRDGSSVAVSGGRASPRVHWRRAHLRNVRHGVGRAEVRPTVIAPCLVNYQDGPEPKKPSYRVVDAAPTPTSG